MKRFMVYKFSSIAFLTMVGVSFLASASPAQALAIDTMLSEVGWSSTPFIKIASDGDVTPRDLTGCSVDLIGHVKATTLNESFDYLFQSSELDGYLVPGNEVTLTNFLNTNSEPAPTPDKLSSISVKFNNCSVTLNSTIQTNDLGSWRNVAAPGNLTAQTDLYIVPMSWPYITEIWTNFIEIYVPENVSTNYMVLRSDYGDPSGIKKPSTNNSLNLGVLTAGYHAISIGDSFKITNSNDRAVWISDPLGIKESLVQYKKLDAGGSWALNEEADLWQIAETPTPGAKNEFPSTNIAPIIINDCVGLRISEIGANLDRQFIEIMNPTGAAVDLSGCQIQTNRSKLVFSFGEEILSSNSFRTIWVADTPLTLTKTTTGTVYLLSSDGQSEVDSVSYAGLAKETAWALVDGEWRQTYSLTPNAANVWAAYPPCEAGYERNLETGRCRKIASEKVLEPCPAGQFRNPETGRCKKIDSGSTLAPCKEGEERNPLTNRCRKIPTDKELEPCAEGYERNPETNRCRKIVESSAAAFAIDNSNMGGGAGGMWKLAAGGAFVAMLLVVAWQFRSEITQRWQNLRKHLTRKAGGKASAETG